MQGVREGWGRGNPLDLNTASKDQLMSLPGITVERADRLVAGRPYQSADEIVSRHIISAQAYDRIKDRVTAKN
ncbi:MAG: competence protein ComEA [Acidobacteriaceae bacterium]